MDLVLNLPNDGIRLVFDPVTQRLKVYNCHKRYMYMLINALGLLEKLNNTSPKTLAAVCLPTVHEQLVGQQLADS